MGSNRVELTQATLSRHHNFSGGTMPRAKRNLCLAAATYIILISISIIVPVAPAQTNTQAHTAAHAPATTGSISGNVSDHQGSPLAGAQVTLTNLTTKESTNGSTDGTGGYSFEDLKPGHYTVVFESKGLVSQTHSIEVKAGKKSKVSERLKPPEVKKKTDVE
jgi:protocatechuate 3,4-dioxygenase beta subunit